MEKPETDQPTPAPDTITLERPIVRGSTTIDSIVLRTPDSGTLRGLKMADVMQGDVNATITLLPRISSPTLTPDEAAHLDPVSLVRVTNAIVGFFLSASEKEAAAI